VNGAWWVAGGASVAWQYHINSAIAAPASHQRSVISKRCEHLGGISRHIALNAVAYGKDSL